MFYLCTLFSVFRIPVVLPADSRYTEHMDFQINFVCTVRSIFPERFLYTKFISDKRNSDAVFVSTGRDCVFVYAFSTF